MSLNHKDKESLHQAIMRLARIIQELEPTSVDPRVLDMLEICGSLLEQQIEMNIVFQTESINNEIVLFDQDEFSNEVVHIIFEEDKDIPSPEDLENWFNLGD